MNVKLFCLSLLLVSARGWATVDADVSKNASVHQHVDIDLDNWDQRITSAQHAAEEAGITSRQWIDRRLEGVTLFWRIFHHDVKHATKITAQEKQTFTGVAAHFREAWNDVHRLFSKSSKETP